MPEGRAKASSRACTFREGRAPGAKRRCGQLLGSGAILNEALKAPPSWRAYGVGADVWSVTSYKELRRDALETSAGTCSTPDKRRACPGSPLPEGRSRAPTVAASDYIKRPARPGGALGARGGLVSLGTDGFGRSEGRAALRDFFEVDARWIALAASCQRARAGPAARAGP
jgi:pyruvate dehydrogenase E1 component